MKTLIMAPGLALMARLTYPKRFALLGLMMLPLVLMIWVSVRETLTNMEFAQREQQRVAYILPVYKLLTQVQQQRILATGLSNGDLSFEAMLRKNEASVDRALAEIDAAQQALGANIKADRWAQIKDAWTTLKREVQNHTVATRLERYAELIEKINALIAEIGDRCRLILDPDLDSTYLIDAVVVRAP
jgi:methyl-accepting chemotaxis protein